jgi:hypothetical protein
MYPAMAEGYIDIYPIAGRPASHCIYIYVLRPKNIGLKKGLLGQNKD